MNIYEILQKSHYELISPKVWGYEVWHINTADYCCKTLVVYPGYQCSRHFHKLKDETFMILDAEFELEVDGRAVHLKRGMSIRIRPYTTHNFRVVGNCIGSMLEISTNHREDDSYRLDTSHHFDLGGETVTDQLGMIGEFRNAHVAVIGDFMLDTYCECAVERISPEAPVPVLVLQDEYYKAGGAGNACMNVTSLGAKCSAFGVVGNDSDAKSLSLLLSNSSVNVDGLLRHNSRPTITKTRFVSGSHHFFRLDTDKSAMPVLDEVAACDILGTFIERLQEKEFTAVLLSDYDKGLFTKDRIAKIVHESHRFCIPVIADPKYVNFMYYDEVDVFKCNLKEAVAAFGKKGMDCVTEESIFDLCRDIKDILHCVAVVITRGRDGMTVMAEDQSLSHISGMVVPIAEVSGAGDTTSGILSIMMGIGKDVVEAAKVANVGAGLVVQKSGTNSVTPTELSSALNSASHC